MPRFVPFLMLFVLLFGLVLMRESREMPGARIEEDFINWLAANTPRAAAPAPVTLVEINDSILSEEHPWPWSPLDFALFLDAILQFRPAVVAIEPVTQWDEKKLNPDALLKQPQYEKILHDRILRAPKILLGAQLGFPEDSDIIPPLQPVQVLRRIKGDTRMIPEFTDIERQPKEELRLAATLGFVNVPASRRAIRRAPLLFLYRGQVVPSFVLQALMLWLKLTPDEVKVSLGSNIALGNKMTVPIDDAGSMLVDFKAPLTRVGFDELLLAVQQVEAKQKPLVSPEAISGKLALLARTDTDARTLKLPIQRKGSPGELFAAAIATAQSGAFIRRVGVWFDACLIAAAMCLSWGLTTRPRRFAVLMTPILFVAYLMGGLTLFQARLIAVPFLLPAGLVVVVVLLRLVTPGAEPKPQA